MTTLMRHGIYSVALELAQTNSIRPNGLPPFYWLFRYNESRNLKSDFWKDIDMTLTMGKRGTIVIPKPIRDECNLAEGTRIDVSLENNAIVLLPSLNTRTRMDDNFDEARAILESKGVTLEMALAKLQEIRAQSVAVEEEKADDRSFTT